MRRANEITDQQLESFCEWFWQRFRTRKVRLEWFVISLLGRTHVPKRDVKDLLKRMQELVSIGDGFVEPKKR